MKNSVAFKIPILSLSGFFFFCVCAFFFFFFWFYQDNKTLQMYKTEAKHKEMSVTPPESESTLTSLFCHLQSLWWSMPPGSRNTRARIMFHTSLGLSEFCNWKKKKKSQPWSKLSSCHIQFNFKLKYKKGAVEVHTSYSQFGEESACTPDSWIL